MVSGCEDLVVGVRPSRIVGFAFRDMDAGKAGGTDVEGEVWYQMGEVACCDTAVCTDHQRTTMTR